MTTVLKDVPEKIALLQEFQGNSLHARWENFNEVTGKKTYAIYSYSTLMAYVTVDDGAIWENEQRYSVTTSKHMNYVRRGFALLRQSEVM